VAGATERECRDLVKLLDRFFPADAGLDVVPEEDEGYYIYVVIPGDVNEVERQLLEKAVPINWYIRWAEKSRERSGYTICSILKQ
jgi:hypothetical protein